MDFVNKKSFKGCSEVHCQVDEAEWQFIGGVPPLSRPMIQVRDIQNALSQRLIGLIVRTVH
jgi:hypothetical protein